MAAATGRFSVLLAEDEDFQRDLLRAYLRAEDGFAVEAHPDGAAALAALRARGYAVDLLLTDMRMPRLDGVGLLQAALGEAPDLTAVVLSADRDEHLILECLRLGAADYLFKPPDPATLAPTLRAVLERRGRFGPTRPPTVATDADGWVTITAPTGLEYIARFRDFAESLWSSRLSAADRETMRFVIDELGRNAVEWGNRFDEGKSLRLSYRVWPDRLELRIADEGDGFPADEWRDPAEDMFGHVMRRRREGKRPGGFGIALARKLLGEVRFNETGNEVVAVKRFATRWNDRTDTSPSE